MTTRSTEQLRIQLRPFQPDHLPAFIAAWNQAFNERRGFVELTEPVFRQRILESRAFDPSGLILAWDHDAHASGHIVGFVHAFRPPPDTPTYRRWGRHHSIAVLYVDPAYRRHGIGSRLLKAAESWLIYCPVHFAGQSTPCYGNVEGPRRPLFGSTQRMGVSARDKELLRFLSERGYAVVDPGDVSMIAHLPAKLSTTGKHAELPRGLRLLRVDNESPFTGREPRGRAEYGTWGTKADSEYTALVLVDDGDMLCGHLSWYPYGRDYGDSSAAIYGFWLDPVFRRRGLGSLLLDSALNEMASTSQPGGTTGRVEVQTHVVRHADAVALYESRGFQIDEAWVTLVKT